MNSDIDTRIPESIDVDAIAEDACQAAFAVIAAGYESAGYPVTGDVDPLTSHQIDVQFRDWVRMMGMNNPDIAREDDRYWSEEITVELDAVDPEALLSVPSGVFVRRGRSLGHSGDVVTLKGPRAEVRRFVADNWDDDEVRATVDLA